MTDPDDMADPERRLACAYWPADRRAFVAALWLLDEVLAQVAARPGEAAIVRIRLAWWHDALAALDQRPPPSQPVLERLARDVLPRGITGATLARLVEGWEALVDADPVDDAALLRYADGRGAALFGAVAQGLGLTQAPIRAGGMAWALVEFAWHARTPDQAARAVRLAAPLLAEAFARRWPVAARPLGMLVRLARADLARLPTARPRRQGSPARLLLMLWHRISGR